MKIDVGDEKFAVSNNVYICAFVSLFNVSQHILLYGFSRKEWKVIHVISISAGYLLLRWLKHQRISCHIEKLFFAFSMPKKYACVSATACNTITGERRLFDGVLRILNLKIQVSVAFLWHLTLGYCSFCIELVRLFIKQIHVDPFFLIA